MVKVVCSINWQKYDISTKNNDITLKTQRIQSFSSLKWTEISHFNHERKYCAKGAKIFGVFILKLTEITYFNHEHWKIILLWRRHDFSLFHPWIGAKLVILTMNNNTALKTQIFWRFSSLKLTEIGHFNHEQHYCSEGPKVLGFFIIKTDRNRLLYQF